MNGQTIPHVTRGEDFNAKEFVEKSRFNKYNTLAFLFDVPFINTISGRAMMREHGDFLEDKDFDLLYGMKNPGWSYYEIVQKGTGARILRDAYYSKLDEQGRAEYAYRRFLSIKAPDGSTVVISTDDVDIIEELIRTLITIGDPDVNRRFQIKSKDDEFLRQFCDVIEDAIAKLEKVDE